MVFRGADFENNSGESSIYNVRDFATTIGDMLGIVVDEANRANLAVTITATSDDTDVIISFGAGP